jgi:Tfp pilus tip-associated adhesin PilY1
VAEWFCYSGAKRNKAPNRVLKIPPSPSASRDLEKFQNRKGLARTASGTIFAAFSGDSATSMQQHSRHCKNNVSSRCRNLSGTFVPPNYGASKLPSRVRLYAAKLSSA